MKNVRFLESQFYGKIICWNLKIKLKKENIRMKSVSFFGISFLRKPIFREGFKSRNPKNRKHKNISGKLESLSNDILVEKIRLQSYNMKKPENIAFIN